MIVKPLLHASFVKVMRTGELVNSRVGFIPIIQVFKQGRLTDDAGVIDKSPPHTRDFVLYEIPPRQSRGCPPIRTIEALEIRNDSMTNLKDASEIIIRE
jgi:hypothetical protein